MHDSACVAECHIGADKDIVCDGLAEDLDAKDISYYLLGFALDVRMDQCDVVVGRYNIAEGREALFYSLLKEAVRISDQHVVYSPYVGRGPETKRACMKK